jgi:predicted Rossmann fold nucleotide-binding protein DprA/Smf involved in DNA uptake
VLVTEAREGSGALITTRFASDQGRDVFAAPGNATSRGGLGCNRLIQDGATLVIEPLDIATELNLRLAPQQMEVREALPENPTEALLLGALVMAELKGLTHLAGPMTYMRARYIPYLEVQFSRLTSQVSRISSFNSAALSRRADLPSELSS